MQNETLYNKTVEILVQAYLNDTLTHGLCTACAVGNIIASSNGYEINKRDVSGFRWLHNGVEVDTRWEYLFMTAFGEQETYFESENVEGRRQCLSTGYSVEDLARIEFAFETALRGNNDDERMFNGLMAVIDVLDEIHGNKDADTTAATKQKFSKVAV